MSKFQKHGETGEGMVGNQVKQALLSNHSSHQVWMPFCLPSQTPKWTLYTRCSLRCTKEMVKIIFMLALLLLLQPMMQLAFITTRAHCWFTVPACPPGPPGPFLQSYFLSEWHPASTLAGVTPSQVKDFALPFSSCLCWAILQPVRAPGVAAWPPSAVTALTSSVSMLTQSCWWCLPFQSSDC